MNSVVTATKARQNFFKLVEKAEVSGASVTITREGEAKVVMMSFEEFEGWQETLDVMCDSEMVKAIREGLEGDKFYSEEVVRKEFGL